MCNRYRVTAKQIEIARQFGFDIGRLMPEPDALPPPELFPKRGLGGPQGEWRKASRRHAMGRAA